MRLSLCAPGRWEQCGCASRRLLKAGRCPAADAPSINSYGASNIGWRGEESRTAAPGAMSGTWWPWRGRRPHHGSCRLAPPHPPLQLPAKRPCVSLAAVVTADACGQTAGSERPSAAHSTLGGGEHAPLSGSSRHPGRGEGASGKGGE